VTEIRSLLERQQVITIEPVFSELLFGVRNGKEKEIVHSYWSVLPKISFEAGSMLKAAEYANQNHYHQLGVGLMDAILIQSVQEGNHLLWTLDRRILTHADRKLLFTT
jgi:hypothetical protein